MELIDRFEYRALDGRSGGLRRLMGTRESSQALGGSRTMQAGAWFRQGEWLEAGAGSRAAVRILTSEAE